MSISSCGGSGFACELPVALDLENKKDLAPLTDSPSGKTPELAIYIIANMAGGESICRATRALRLKEVIQKRSPQIKEMIEFFIKNIKGHPEVIKVLQDLLHSNPLSASETLLELKEELFGVRSNLASILKLLSDDELNALKPEFEGLQKHPSFIRLIDLGFLYKTLEPAKAIANNYERTEQLASYVKALIDVNDLKMASSLLDSFTVGNTTDTSLMIMAEAYAKQGCYEKALHIATHIPDQYHSDGSPRQFFKINALCRVVQVCIEHGNLDFATRVAVHIPDEGVLAQAMDSIAKAKNKQT